MHPRSRNFVFARTNNPLYVGVGGIDIYSTTVFLVRYYYIPTTGVAELQAPHNNMLRS